MATLHTSDKSSGGASLYFIMLFRKNEKENRAKAALWSLFWSERPPFSGSEASKREQRRIPEPRHGMEKDSAMDIDLQPEEEVEGDPDPNGDGAVVDLPGWSWIVSRILKTCIAYSSGVTPAILLSELSLAWSEQRRIGASTKRLEFIEHLKKNNRRTKLPNTVTIDSIYEKNFLSLNSVLEAVIVDAFVLPGTNIQMLTLGDYSSSNLVDLYLHR
ncbi:uncharacterized protein LOC114718863, partial [Neltuma alba]|uniref:uncharacterized protein LOC114718863 n=1 Tax=Neltuma alba TaxID=207710 RepID=UPI0010A2E2E7